jgi:hypothetical protein
MRKTVWLSATGLLSAHYDVPGDLAARLYTSVSGICVPMETSSFQKALAEPKIIINQKE